MWVPDNACLLFYQSRFEVEAVDSSSHSIFCLFYVVSKYNRELMEICGRRTVLTTLFVLLKPKIINWQHLQNFARNISILPYEIRILYSCFLLLCKKLFLLQQNSTQKMLHMMSCVKSKFCQLSCKITHFFFSPSIHNCLKWWVIF